MPIVLILVSVGLSAFAQTLFRIGMTRPDVQAALNGGGVGLALLRPLLSSPHLWGGMAAYGVGVLLWLFVLSRVPVSFAYPFVALGIAITTLSGVLILGETMSRLSLAGIVIIVAGILVMALGRSA